MPDVENALEELVPAIRQRRDEIERARRLPPDLVADLAATGVFRMCLPEALGGLEADPDRQVRVVESMARVDGSVGWCVMIAMGSPFLAGWLPDDGAAEIYGDPHVVTGGVTMPTGMAVPEDGGFRLTGRWSFASGVQHSAWMMAACLVLEDGRPRRLDGKLPDLHFLFVPAAELEVIDTWDVSGLRGTGSHDFTVQNVLVPARRSFRLFSPPVRPEPLYAMPLLTLFAPHVAAVSLGIARAALDELTALAHTKKPAFRAAHLADYATVQADLARAEGHLQGARSFLYDSLGQAWDLVRAGDQPSMRLRALVRIAACSAAATAARVVDTAYTLAGGGAVYARSPLQRHLRDVHTVTQHVAVAPGTFESAGRVLLGLEPDVPLF